MHKIRHVRVEKCPAVDDQISGDFDCKCAILEKHTSPGFRTILKVCSHFRHFRRVACAEGGHKLGFMQATFSSYRMQLHPTGKTLGYGRYWPLSDLLFKGHYTEYSASRTYVCQFTTSESTR